MISYSIYCSPGDLAACWSQMWDCPAEVIEELFELSRVPTDREEQYQRVRNGILELRRRGYKKAEYCADCGHRIMRVELERRNAHQA